MTRAVASGSIAVIRIQTGFAAIADIVVIEDIVAIVASAATEAIAAVPVAGTGTRHGRIIIVRAAASSSVRSGIAREFALNNAR